MGVVPALPLPPGAAMDAENRGKPPLGVLRAIEIELHLSVSIGGVDEVGEGIDGVLDLRSDDRPRQGFPVFCGMGRKRKDEAEQGKKGAGDWHHGSREYSARVQDCPFFLKSFRSRSRDLLLDEFITA
jgi:hypothetical protein